MTESYLEQFAKWLANLWPKVEAPLADPHRRTFLLAVSAAAASGLLSTVDTDALLWEPGKKTFFLPPPVEIFNDADMYEALEEVGAYTSPGGNTFLTPQWITREALRFLKQNLLFHKNVHQEYDKSFNLGPAAMGSTFEMRRPSRFESKTPKAYPVVKDSDGLYTYNTAKRLAPRPFLGTDPAPDTSFEVVHHEPVQLAIDVAPELMRANPRAAAKLVGDQLAAELEKRGYADKIAAVAELSIPSYVEQSCVATDAESGLSIRSISAYDIMQDRTRHRFDLKIFV